MTQDAAKSAEIQEEGLGGLWPPHWLLSRLGRTRVQIAGALLFGVLVPVAFRWGTDIDGWLLPEQISTIVATASAITLGLIGLRQLARLPGVEESIYCVPALLVSFLLALAALLMLRLEYNRYLFPISFALTIVWVFVAHALNRRYRTVRLAIVPGGEVDTLGAIREVEWLPLDTPTLPRGRLNGLIVDLRQDLEPHWERFIADCALAGIRIFHVKQIRESLTGRLEITHLSENTLGSLNPDALYLKVKQGLDWIFALVALIVLSPALLLVGLVIRLESPGPAIFRQTRIGFRGRPFKVLKFRTMHHDGRPGDTLASAVTTDTDPRITRLGKFLRRTRIDELPQLFNVLKGEMSWIGPRPETAPLSKFYDKQLSFYGYRNIVRPGISGWAQVNQGHVTGADQTLEKLHYDFYYIKNFSPWLDLLIAFRTVAIVVSGFGSK
ncbi:sugar transferase [Devosia insulae]|uniref:sugar transferase n=1 Tax=Devosia insulae TaxID=408174 RepID=UPI0009FB9CB3|nr:sugar transferase [Devosia insulae]